MMTGRLFNFPHWGWGNPLGELALMRRQMDRLLGDMTGFSPQYDDAGVFPLVNIFEDQNGYTIRAELPGLSSDDLEITAKGQSLSISGERKIASKGEHVRFHRRERQEGTFNRAIALPTELNIEKIEGGMKDGVLTIRAPKAEAAALRRVRHCRREIAPAISLIAYQECVGLDPVVSP